MIVTFAKSYKWSGFTKLVSSDGKDKFDIDIIPSHLNTSIRPGFYLKIQLYIGQMSKRSSIDSAPNEIAPVTPHE